MNPYIPQMQPFQSRFQPMYSQGAFPQEQMDTSMNGSMSSARMEMSPDALKEMEQAFERALKDAQDQTAAEQSREHDEEEIEEIVREPKGDLEA